MKKFAILSAAAILAASFYAMPVNAAGWEQGKGGSWAYVKGDGTKATGWLSSGGKWYFLDSSGNMKTGWVKAGGSWYFLDRHGVMQTGLIHDGKDWYCLDEKGALLEGSTDGVETLSATGKSIRLEDGAVYVDGILIANKTYPLPRSYDPGGLKEETQSAYEAMKQDAAAAGIKLTIVSGYRSYDYQAGLYNKYVKRDGKAAADTYSARAGYSEHQTGYVIDVNNASSSFTGTKEALWVAENGWKYGFIIRYPKGKEAITGYQHESWHLRYIGKEAAKEVYESGLCLEEYLGISSYYMK